MAHTAVYKLIADSNNHSAQQGGVDNYFKCDGFAQQFADAFAQFEFFIFVQRDSRGDFGFSGAFSCSYQNQPLL